MLTRVIPRTAMSIFTWGMICATIVLAAIILPSTLRSCEEEVPHPSTLGGPLTLRKRRSSGRRGLGDEHRPHTTTSVRALGDVPVCSIRASTKIGRAHV